MNQQTEHARFFRQLHQAGNPFILANAWDIGSARLLAASGASALATTSAGFAFTLGQSDGGVISAAASLEHAADLVGATDLPISADLENGYGDSPQDVADTVRRAIDIGLAGCSIEDIQLPTTKPYSLTVAVARIEAAIAVARKTAADFVLTARADGLMVGRYNLAETICRLRAYESAGADVLYAPMPPDMDSLARICDSVSAPINALVAGDFCRYTIGDFAAIGIARISLGSSLARITHAAIQHSAQAMFADGDFSSLLAAADGDDIDAMLKKGAKVNQ